MLGDAKGTPLAVVIDRGDRSPEGGLLTLPAGGLGHVAEALARAERRLGKTGALDGLAVGTVQ